MGDGGPRHGSFACWRTTLASASRTPSAPMTRRLYAQLLLSVLTDLTVEVAVQEWYTALTR